MNITRSTQLITAAVGAAISAAAIPALLVVGAGTAQAHPDVSERSAIAIIDNIPTPRYCPSCVEFNPQPDPPGYPVDHLPINNRPEYGGPDSIPSLEP